MLGGLLEFLFGPLRDRLYGSHFQRRDKEKGICREAATRIRKERGNFEHIVAGKGYSGEYHKRAVEQYSFELLQSSMNSLNRVGKFRKAATSVSEQIEKRNAAGVLELINQLEPKLDRLADT